MAVHTYTVAGNVERATGIGWSEAANQASERLFQELVDKHGKGKVKFLSIDDIKFTAVPDPNPGSIQVFGVSFRVTADHP